MSTREPIEAAMREALRDMLAGWQYIRRVHGDLYGVGWDRAESKAIAALAAQAAEASRPDEQVNP